MNVGCAITEAMREQKRRDEFWNLYTWTLEGRRRWRRWAARC